MIETKRGFIILVFIFYLRFFFFFGGGGFYMHLRNLEYIIKNSCILKDSFQILFFHKKASFF